MIDLCRIRQLQAATVIGWHEQAEERPDHVEDFADRQLIGQVEDWAAGDVRTQALLRLVEQQHEFNFRLWHKEDIARCPESSDAEIAQVKRDIDRLNQQRNDWIEKIDEWLVEDLTELGIEPNSDVRINTETPGSAIDRLSILALRLYHLKEQLERVDLSPTLRASVEQKIVIGELQAEHLAQALGELLDDIYQGRKRHQTYRQMKMYNDPNLNPYLVAAREAS